LEERLKIPNYRIENKLGNGANGTVYRAYDEWLNRYVAIKVWNKQGKARAREEISKIAQIQNDLFVSTYQFGNIGDVPYAIMEFIDGMDGKAWLKTEPNLDIRRKVWNQYSQALRLLYEQDVYHGDPHLGNVLISNKNNLINPIVKIADTGTSYFWDDHSDFEKRDRDLVIETALKIFKKTKIKSLIDLPEEFSPINLLGVIDSYSNMLQFLDSEPDSYAYGRNAGYIVDQAIQIPLYNLTELIRIARERGLTSSRRINLRLNAALFGIDDFLDADDKFTDHSAEEYKKVRGNFIKKYSSY
jgi:serine/threonine protein kinase